MSSVLAPTQILLFQFRSARVESYRCPCSQYSLCSALSQLRACRSCQCHSREYILRLKRRWESRHVARGEWSTYNAMREDTMPAFPFAHPTARGLNVMVPPQANPIHPTVLGATSWTMASYGSITVEGSEMRREIPVVLVHDE